jgi:hypothetical protein
VCHSAILVLHDMFLYLLFDFSPGASVSSLKMSDTEWYLGLGDTRPARCSCLDSAWFLTVLPFLLVFGVGTDGRE